MATTIASGKIPFYGAINNGAKSIKNTIQQYDYRKEADFQKQGVCENFEYVLPWTITLGGRQVNVLITLWDIKFYTQTSSDFMSHLKPKVVSSDDSTIVGTVTDYDNWVYTLFYNDHSSFYYPYSSIYIKDTGSMCFIRFEGVYTLELIIMNDGYIQIRSEFGNGYTAYGYKIAEIPVEYSGWYNTYSCDNCSYKNDCSYYSSTRTSCYYGFTDLLYTSNNAPDFQYNMSNYSKGSWYVADNSKKGILLCPSTMTGDYNFTALEGYYISNTGMTPMAGELKLYCKKSGWNADDYYYRLEADNEQGYYEYSKQESYNFVHHFPLFESKSSTHFNLNVRAGGKNLYLRLRKDGDLDGLGDYSIKDKILSLGFNDLIYRNGVVRTKDKNVECFSGIFNNAREVTGNVFTQGTSTSSSSYAYWYGGTSISFSSRPYVSKITLLIKFHTVALNGRTTVPSSSVPTIRFYYNTGTTDITGTINTNNMSYIDFTLSSPYLVHTVQTFTINNYLKQFLVVPVVTRNTVDSTSGYTYSIEAVNLNMYGNSEDSFTYTL